MGSHDFQDYQAKTATIVTAQHAYSALVRAATEEYGTDGYNGTISTTNGFTMKSTEPMPRSLATSLVFNGDFEDGEWWQGIEKWECCGCIPICAEAGGTNRTVTAKLTIDDYDSYINVEWVKQNIERFRFQPKEGEMIESVKVLVDDPTYKVKTTRHRGKARRVFTVNGTKFDDVDQAVLSAEGHAKNRINAGLGRARPGDGPRIANTGHSVIETVERGDSAATATVDIILERRKLELEIKLLKRAPLKDRTVIGWFFYGWAAS